MIHADLPGAVSLKQSMQLAKVSTSSGVQQSPYGRWRATSGRNSKTNGTLGPYASKKRAEAAALAIRKYGITEARRRVPPDKLKRARWSNKEDSNLIRVALEFARGGKWKKGDISAAISAASKHLPGRTLMSIKIRLGRLRKVGKLPRAIG